MIRPVDVCARVLMLGAFASVVACSEDVTAPDIVDANDAQLAVHGASGVGPELAAVRAATARYHDADVADADGFAGGTPCVAHPVLGGMGFHHLNGARFGDGTVVADEPEVLLYEPTRAGLQLVGVEYLVLADAWDATNSGAPELFGVEFDEHRGADTHGLPFDHYELHLWNWRHNPAGLTAPFNPKVSCEGAS